MAKTDVLSLAILGMLAEQPLHGYQVRKLLGAELGPFRALSYGSLYPCLRRMEAEGLITLAEDDGDGRGSRRSRIAYALTPAGKAAALAEWAEASGIPLERTVAVGDGANDLEMLGRARLGVAFCAKPVVRRQADIAIDTPDLSVVLPLLGLRG